MNSKRKITKPKSPAQKAVHQLGMDLFATGSTSQLIKFFRENKMPNAASQLEQMLVDARVLAKVKYENERRRIDSEWKSPSELFKEDLAKQDAEDWKEQLAAKMRKLQSERG